MNLLIGRTLPIEQLTLKTGSSLGKKGYPSPLVLIIFSGKCPVCEEASDYWPDMVTQLSLAGGEVFLVATGEIAPAEDFLSGKGLTELPILRIPERNGLASHFSDFPVPSYLVLDQNARVAYIGTGVPNLRLLTKMRDSVQELKGESVARARVSDGT